MKRIFIDKPEPLLIVIPLILFLLYKIFSMGMFLETSILFWGVYAFVIVPFLLHSLLRASGKWDAALCRPHVYITIFLLTILFITLYTDTQNNPLPQQNELYSLTGRIQELERYTLSFLLIFLTGVFVQFLFVVYFLIRIFQKAQ